jgi:two-component system nitrate/nitrite response regulator NarL
MIDPMPLLSFQRDLSRLTQREIQIVRLVCEGLSNKEIARRMGISEGTIKFRLHLIYRKLAITNRTSLATLALRTEVA